MLLAERMLNLPTDLVPNLHTDLPADLEFTRGCEEIKDPKEFNYDYIIIISKFTVPNSKNKAGVQKLDSATERRYYK